MAEMQVPAVSDFESQVWAGDIKGAMSSLFAILGEISKGGGTSPQLVSGRNMTAFGHVACEVTATRMASAVAELFARDDVRISEGAFVNFMLWHRWLALIFNVSSFGNADFVYPRARLRTSEDFIQEASSSDLFKIAILYGSESRLPLNFTALFKRSPRVGTSLAIALLSHRICATPVAHEKRELLLKWTNEALDKLESPDGLPMRVMIDLWMHTSYSLDRDKHALKRPLNRLLRRHIEKNHIAEPELLPSKAERPSVFVFLEWFHKTHSIMRTHSLSMLELKKHYRLVGFGPHGMVDEAGRELFDEFHYFEEFSPDLKFLRPILDLVARDNPVATYMPSVGMGLHSLYLINLRLAPKQVIALGHPATTHSDKVDHVLVEEDYVGDPDVFSEDVVCVPKNALPYIRPSIELEKRPRKKNAPVRIAVPTAVMKLNPVFLDACRQVLEKAENKAEFHFLLGGAPELIHRFAEKAIEAQVPGSVVHKSASNPVYMANVRDCDMFANPFPFGNTNGIVDTVYCGLAGVCLIGDEVHEHIDKGMFTRMNFPDWTITYNIDDYVNAIVRLVDDDTLREDLSRRITEERWDEVLYHGNPSAFSDKFVELVSTNPEQQTR